VWAWLVIAALPVFFLSLGANTIWEANEAFYVETPQHMVETGDYVTPWFNGQPRLNKPVLSYWIVAAFYRVFGVSVAVERAAIALGALGIVLAAFVLGRALRSTATGWLAALIVATSPRVVMWSRRIFIDVYITCFLSIALACFVLAERQPQHRRRWLGLMYIAIGLGVLTKGPIAVFLPVLVCALWWTMERRWRDWRTAWIVPGAIIVAAIVVPWYAALYHAHGWEPIRQFVVGENLERYASPDSSQHRPIWFYVPVLLTDLFPWAPLIVLPLARAWRRPTTADPAQPADRAGVRRLLWGWVVAIAGFFSFSASKQDLYIFPVIAPAAALVADTLVGHAFGARSRAIRATLMGVAALSIVVAGLAWWLFGTGYFALAGTRLAAAALGGGSVTVIVLLLRARPRGAVAALAATFIVFNVVFVTRILPSLDRLKPTAAFAGVLRARSGPQANLGYYHLSLPSLSFYTGRPIQEIGTVEHAQAFFADPNGGWMIMSPESFDELRGAVPGICIVAARPMFDATASQLIHRQPPSDALVVSNRGCGPPGAASSR
jgi:4-amino-4-deoxy-L-arabinose transferase-like glycosyltransferase